MYKISILGKYTFDCSVLLNEEELQTSPVYVFAGRSWVRCDDVTAAQKLCVDVLNNRYDNSSRDTPTGFGFVANSDQVIFANVDGLTRKAIYTRAITISEIGLTRKALIKDMRELYREEDNGR